MPDKDKIFHINTNIDPEQVLNRAWAVQRAKEDYQNKYNAYLEQHPLPKMTGVGYNPYLGTQYNPEVQRQQAAHLYAQQESGYNAEDPTAPYKQADEKFAKFSGDVLGAALFAPEFATYGLAGGAARIGGGMLGGAIGGYAGSEVGKGLDKTFGTHWLEPTLGIAGGFAGWGKGSRLLSNIAENGALKYISRTGKQLPKWFINYDPVIGKINARTFFAEDQTPKYNPNQLQELNKQLYQSPSASQLEMIPQAAFVSNIPKQAYQRLQTSLTPLKEVFGDSTNIPDMVDFYKGSKPMLFGDMREITRDPNFGYFQGRPSIQYDRPNGRIGKFYINQDRLKQTIGAYKDLYTSRLNLPNTATVDDVYNYILSNPAKIDPALNSPIDNQDILGLSLGYGIKDAILFKDPHLLDLDGVYKETVPSIFDILSKRMNLKQLKREHGTFNGNHATWKFRTSVLDDWKTKDKPKINLFSLNEDLPRESIPMWKRIGPIIRKAQSDLEAMNPYHMANVEEWNKTFRKNFKAVPFRKDIGGSKIMTREEFINALKQVKTNSPSDDLSKADGYYNIVDDQVRLPNDAKSSGAYHEFLHQGMYGTRNPQVTQWRIGQLIDPKRITHLNPRQINYYLSETELPVYLRQMGENMNINVGDPYPGDERFDQMLFDNPIIGSANYIKRDTPEEKQLFWRALNGTLFGGLGAAAISKEKNGGKFKNTLHK